MSAAAKLKATMKDLWGDDPPSGYEVPWDVVFALPQIVAVIEAAESLPEFFDGGKHSFVPLLDALEEALT